MTVTLAIIAWVLAGIVALARPRFGAVLIWFIAWLYPNTLLYGTMPLNIRFDDLWVVLVFLVCFVFPRARRTTGAALGLSIAWTASIVLGDAVGLFATAGATWETMIKTVAKAFYVPMTTYVLCVLLDRQDHLEKHLRWLGLAGVAAGILGIVMVYFPSELNAFLIPTFHYDTGQTALESVMEQEFVTARRAQGAVGTIALACIELNVSLLCLCMMIYHKKHAGRVFFAVTTAGCLVSLAYTTTRSAIGGVLAAVAWGIFFTRRRAALLAIAFAAACAIVYQGGLLERILLRTMGSGMGATGTTLAQSWQTRTEIFSMFIDRISPTYFLLGMGKTGVFAQAQASVHNAYIGAIAYGGLFGAIMLVLVIRQGIILGRRAAAVQSDWMAQALGTYLLMLVIAMMVQGMAGENFQQTLPMQMYFAALVFVEARLAQIAPAVQPVAQPLRIVSQPTIMPGPFVPRP